MSETGQPKPEPSHSPTGISFAYLSSRLIGVIVILAAILFGLAGRLDWLQAWLFILAFGGFLVYYGVWGLHNNPGQLQERSQVGQNTKTWDRLILTIYTILLLAMLVVAGLDAGRFKWSPAPVALQVVGWLGLILAGRQILWVTSTNTFLSPTVRIQEERGQQVITTGPYRWVRHPMYSGVIVVVVCIPLVLGSTWTLVPRMLIGILFVIRTALEDRTLQKELPGYDEYAKRVRYRLLPGIW